MGVYYDYAHSQGRRWYALVSAATSEAPVGAPVAEVTARDHGADWATVTAPVTESRLPAGRYAVHDLIPACSTLACHEASVFQQWLWINVVEVSAHGVCVLPIDDVMQ